MLLQAYRSILAKFAVTPRKPSRDLPAEGLRYSPFGSCSHLLRASARWRWRRTPVDTAIGLGLEPEEFVRDRALASTILPKLSDVALEWFTGRVSWLKANSEPDRRIGQRVELNAFTTAAS